MAPGAITRRQQSSTEGVRLEGEITCRPTLGSNPDSSLPLSCLNREFGSAAPGSGVADEGRHRPDQRKSKQLLRAIREVVRRAEPFETQHADQLMYRALAEHSQVGLYVYQDEVFRYVNPTMAEIFGYSVEELIGAFRTLDLVHPDDRPMVEENVRRRTEGEVDAIHYTFRGQRKDGSTIHCEVLGRTLQIAGEPVIVGTLLDITKRERAEHELKTLSRAVKHSASMVMITDIEGLIEYVNPKFTEVTGYAADEVIGKNVRLLRSKETPPGTYPQLWETILGGREWKGLFRNRKRNGELYWASSTISPIREKSGLIRQFIAVQEDVTDQVNAESTLRKQAADLALLNSVNSLVNSGEDFETITRYLVEQIKLNFGCENGSLYLVNAETDRLDLVTLGSHPQLISWIGSTIRCKIPPISISLKDAELHRATLRRGRPELIRDPKVIRQLMAEHTDSALLRQTIPAAANMLNIATAINVPLLLDGEPVGLLSVSSSEELGQAELERLGALAGPITVAVIRKQTEDRTRRLTEELEERVRARTAQLEAANQELESFSYSVSHDLRAPLRAIDGFTHALLEEYAEQMDETGKHYMQRVRNATLRMGQLIDALLSLSRVARSELKLQQVDLTELARSVAAELQRSDPDRKVQFDFEPDLTVDGDSTLLRVVMENLLGNAWKFTAGRADARIELGAMEVEGQAAFYVRDNGAGFGMQFVDKIFDAFQRLHSANEFPGSGVGLASVRRAIHRHGGRVWAEGEVDRGATFYVSLPPS